MLKLRTKKTSLAFMGEGWEQAYIESRMLTTDDQALMDEIQANKELNLPQQGKEIVKLFFVSGKGPNESGEQVDITKEDIDHLDVFSIGEIASQVGMPDPKASESSTPTFEASEPFPDDSSSSSTGNASI